MSTGNLNVGASNEDFALRLGTRLKLLKKQKESFNVIEEDFAEEICDQCKSAEEFYNKLDLKISEG